MISAEKIPNNVNLSGNKRLQRALEHWQPKYIQWWRDMGPQGFQDYHQVYVRTATSVDPEGWAHFEYVKLPEYRWGIFLADPVHDRRIGFGDFFSSSQTALLSEIVPPDQRTKVLGGYRFSADLGAFVGPVLLAAVAMYAARMRQDELANPLR